MVLTFFVFPMIVLSHFHGWLIGAVGYFLVVMLLGVVADKLPKQVALFVFQPILTLPVFYAFCLALGWWLALAFWVGLAVLFFLLNYYQYKTNLQYIQKHRNGVEIVVQFPEELPPIKKAKERTYFDPVAFGNDFKKTFLLSLPMQYEVNGKSCKGLYNYHLEAQGLELSKLSSYYNNYLKGSSLTLQYIPEQPTELMEIIPPNDLSTFEAFTMEQYREGIKSNAWHLLFIMAFAAVFYCYL